MIRISADQDMGQKTRPGSPAFSRARWSWRLHNGLAARAGFTRSHNAVHHKAAWTIFRFLDHILTQRPGLAAAPATILARRQHSVVAIRMTRQWPAAVPACRFILFGLSGPGLIQCRPGDPFIPLRGQDRADRGFLTANRTDAGCDLPTGAATSRSATPGIEPHQPKGGSPPAVHRGQQG